MVSCIQLFALGLALWITPYFPYGETHGSQGVKPLLYRSNNSILTYSNLDLGIDPLIKAIGEGNSESLSQFFAPKLDLVLPNQEGGMNKNQAKEKLSSFFIVHKPKSFTLIHQGSAKGQSTKYLIGNLLAQNGTSYRVYLSYKESGNSIIIHSLRIE
jgi:hypothetical protein